MPFTTHELEEIREGNTRACCRRCGQTWTSWNVRSACPGVPVSAYEQIPAYLKTLTQLQPRPPVTIGDLELHRLSYLHHHLPDHLNDQCGLIFVDQMSASGGDDLPALRREVC